MNATVSGGSEKSGSGVVSVVKKSRVDKFNITVSTGGINLKLSKTRNRVGQGAWRLKEDQRNRTVNRDGYFHYGQFTHILHAKHKRDYGEYVSPRSQTEALQLWEFKDSPKSPAPRKQSKLPIVPLEYFRKQLLSKEYGGTRVEEIENDMGNLQWLIKNYLILDEDLRNSLHFIFGILIQCKSLGNKYSEHFGHAAGVLIPLWLEHQINKADSIIWDLLQHQDHYSFCLSYSINYVMDRSYEGDDPTAYLKGVSFYTRFQQRTLELINAEGNDDLKERLEVGIFVLKKLRVKGEEMMVLYKELAEALIWRWLESDIEGLEGSMHALTESINAHGLLISEIVSDVAAEYISSEHPVNKRVYQFLSYNPGANVI